MKWQTKLLIHIILPAIIFITMIFMTASMMRNTDKEMDTDIVGFWCDEPFDKEFYNDSFVSPERRTEVLEFYNKNEKPARDLQCLIVKTWYNLGT